jgi:hypothetical protein
MDGQSGRTTLAAWEADDTIDVTDVFTAAQNSLPSVADVSGGGTVFVPGGNYVVNDLPPKSLVLYKGIGNRKSRLIGTTSSVFTSTAATEYVGLEDLYLETINTKAAINLGTWSSGHWSINMCAFASPSQYGIYGYLILSRVENTSFGYFDGTQKMTTGVYLATAANQNKFSHCKFYRMTGPAIRTADHAYNNTFEYCDFETLDDKVADIVQGDSTNFYRCWAENINLVSNADNCVIKFGNGNSSANVFDGFRLTGPVNYTEKFFEIGSAQPKIKLLNSFIGANYTGINIITLTADDIFWYQGNREESGIPVTIAGAYSYFTDGVADTTGNLSLFGFRGTAISGTWTMAYNSYLPSLTRTANNNTEEIYVIEIPLPLLTTSYRGIKPTSVTVVYNVTGADAGDDFGITMRTRVAPADGSAPAAVTNLSMAYDADHNTAAKRSNSDASTHAAHTLTKTFSAPTYLNADNTTLVVVLSATEANDATGALAIVVKDIILHYATR